jgi:hypothetical protein
MAFKYFRPTTSSKALIIALQSSGVLRSYPVEKVIGK